MLRKYLAAAAAVLAVAFQTLPTAAKPYNFTVPPMDQVQDLHGNPSGPQLAIFMAGNQYMVMPALLAAFRRAHPEIRQIYYETLPPGIVAHQIASNGLEMGNLVIDTKPDVFMSGRRRMRAMREGRYVRSAEPYASNVLAIMVAKSNPKHIRSLADLGRTDVRVSMPNPRWEGVAEQIDSAYRKAGGAGLVNRIMQQKVAAKTTILTSIHHRQTPYFIREGRADAGPVWISEALYQERIGAPIGLVRIPAADNVTASYEAAVLRKAPHPGAAQAFLEFLKSSQAQRIFRSYGFGPPS